MVLNSTSSLEPGFIFVCCTNSHDVKYKNNTEDLLICISLKCDTPRIMTKRWYYNNIQVHEAWSPNSIFSGRQLYCTATTYSLFSEKEPHSPMPMKSDVFFH